MGEPFDPGGGARRGGEGDGEVAGVVALDVEGDIDIDAEEEVEEDPTSSAEKRGLNLVVEPSFSSPVAMIPTPLGVARYCALRVVTRIACLSNALSATPLGRKLSKASKARKPSFLPVDEKEYGEDWTDVRRNLFRWIFP